MLLVSIIIFNLYYLFDGISTNDWLREPCRVHTTRNLEGKYNCLYRTKKYYKYIYQYLNEEFDINDNIINYKKLLLKNI